MKAVIVECSNGAAIVLCDDGSFRKLKNKGYSIGQELLVRPKTAPAPNRMMQKLSICASLALVLLSSLGIGSYSYVKPYSYVSLDINPSIEYALNRYDKVISVSGINKKGEQVVSSIESDVKNQNIRTALGLTIRQLEKENYIMKKEYNHVIVSVCSTNDSKAQSIASSLNALTEKESKVCLIDTMTVSREVKNNADSLGITPAKLALINAVAGNAGSDFDVSKWTELSVSELENTIQQAYSQSLEAIKAPDSPKAAGAAVINSEYLSSVLDENTAFNTALNSDSVSTLSIAEANVGNDSAATDKQTNKSDITTGSTASKPNHTTNAAANSISAGVDKPVAADIKNDTAAGQGSEANQNTLPAKVSPDKNGDSSSSKATSPSEAGNGQNESDVLTEDSSIKKDSYPSSDTDSDADVPDADTSGADTMENFSNSDLSNSEDTNSLTNEGIEQEISSIPDINESGETQIIDKVSE